MSENEKQKKQLLLIDDDEFLIDMYSTKFTGAGFAVMAMRSVDEALGKLREGYTPAIILLDLVMPTVGGIAFLKARRDERLAPDAVVIVLSNQSDEARIEEAKKLGAKGYILKANTVPSEVLEQVQALAG
ncbi:MAG: response regulator [bacterium]|nr:response regulator [bacterium]MDZ4284263.1 response regulator [Patescibacteria group bacterium]